MAALVLVENEACALRWVGVFAACSSLCSRLDITPGEFKEYKKESQCPCEVVVYAWMFDCVERLCIASQTFFGGSIPGVSYEVGTFFHE